MSASDFLKHLLNIVHGLAASVACFGLFYLAGQGLLALVSIRLRSESSSSAGIACDGYPAVLAAALYTLWCWYGIRLGVGLVPLMWTFWGVALAGALIAWRKIVGWATRPAAVRGRTLEWLLAFGLFYVVAYSFFTPTVSGEDLPLAQYYNNDLMNYLNFTRALQDVRSSNVAGLSYVASPYYIGTPAVFYMIGLLSTFFKMDPMHAAMPALFGVSALIALLAARISRAAFSASWLWATAIGATLISGPFFRYVAGNYFLSTLFSLPVALHLVWTTTAFRARGRAGVIALAMRFGAHYVLLLFAYPVLLVIALALQACIFASAAVTSLARRKRKGADEDQTSSGIREVCAAVAAVALMIATAPLHVVTAARNVLNLSQIGVAGWPLDFISPLAVLGFPGRADQLELETAGHAGYAIALTGVAVAVLVSGYFWWFRSSTNHTERVWVGIGAGSVLAYCIVFSVVGRSYQQWKVASYLLLPLSFVLFAATLRLGALAVGETAALSSVLRRVLAVALPWAMAFLFVGGNLRVHAADEPPLRRFPAALTNLGEIDKLKFFREMYVEMGGFGVTFMPVYFIRDKELHLISESYYPREKLSLDRVSRTWPYFTENFECDAVGHTNTMTIHGVGCLLFDPPSPELDTSYPFSRTFMFMTSMAGLGPPEPWGRWSVGNLVQIELEADAQRMPLDREVYLNLQMRPYLPPRAQHQRLLFSWGSGGEASVDLAAREWLSVRLDKAHWKGVRVRTVMIRLDLPDAVAPSTVQDSPETRPLAVAFEDLSLSTSPRGRLLASGSENVHR